MSTVKTPAQIVAANTGNFPVVEDTEFLGGVRVVADDTALGDINVALIKQGMLVRVLSSANNGGADTWYENINGLAGAAGSGEWGIVPLAGSAPSLPSLVDVDSGMSPNKGDVLYWDSSEWVALPPWSTYLVGTGDDATHANLADAITAVNVAGSSVPSLILIDQTYSGTDLADAALTITAPTVIRGKCFSNLMASGIVLSNVNLTCSGSSIGLEDITLSSASGTGAVVALESGANGYVKDCKVSVTAGTKSCLSVDASALIVQHSFFENTVNSGIGAFVTAGGFIVFDSNSRVEMTGTNAIAIHEDSVGTSTEISVKCSYLEGRILVDGDECSLEIAGSKIKTTDESAITFTAPGVNCLIAAIGSEFDDDGVGGSVPWVAADAATLKVQYSGLLLRNNVRRLNPLVDTNLNIDWTNSSQDSNATWISDNWIDNNPSATGDGATLVYDGSASNLGWNWLPSTSVKGGYVTVDDVTARDALPAGILQDAMVAWTRTGPNTSPAGYQRVSGSWEPISWASTPYIVDNSSDVYPYSSLQDAVDDAPEGAVIYVRTGSGSYGDVTSTHLKIKIIGVGFPLLDTFTWTPPAGEGALVLDSLEIGSASEVLAVDLNGGALSSPKKVRINNCTLIADGVGAECISIHRFIDSDSAYHILNCNFRLTNSSNSAIDLSNLGFLWARENIIHSSGDGISLSSGPEGDPAIGLIANNFIISQNNGITVGKNSSSLARIINNSITAINIGINLSPDIDTVTIFSNYIVGMDSGVNMSGSIGAVTHNIFQNLIYSSPSTGYMIFAGTATITVNHAYNSWAGDPSDIGRRIRLSSLATFHNGTEPTPT